MVDFFTLRVDSEVPSESMALKGLVDPMFVKVLNQLSLGAQQYLNESGLSDPGVFESFLGDPTTEVEELAFEPGDVPKLKELLQQAHRAAHGQRAEFARKGTDEFVRRDKGERKHDSTKPKDQPSSKGLSKLRRHGTVDVFHLVWLEARSSKGTVERGRKPKRKRECDG